jgi:hypothetical protein
VANYSHQIKEMNRQNRNISNFGGYVCDLIRLAQGTPINLHSYMKYLALRSLGKRTCAKCLIESGTFLGVTAARCSRNFERVLTIELDVQLANKASAYLRRFDNVEVFQGDAVKLLPQLIARDDASAVVVFLDGHYSGGDTALAEVPEPAILELEILGQHRDRICGIIVDDFRLFGMESGFPKKSDLILAIERFFPPPDFKLSIHADQLIVERQ